MVSHSEVREKRLGVNDLRRDAHLHRCEEGGACVTSGGVLEERRRVGGAEKVGRGTEGVASEEERLGDSRRLGE